MSVARTALSLCVAGSYIYAFGGLNKDEKPLTSIERLSVNYPLESTKGDWQLLNDV